jgi:hypothetical protein
MDETNASSAESISVRDHEPFISSSPAGQLTGSELL